MEKKNVHIISHTHWDREWYIPFETLRIHLVKLIDNCIDLIENDKDFTGFHLDGQTVVLEDYLEIKPENKEILKKYISEGRLAVGPWYVLQDEFLTSSEANVRNLLFGMEIAESFGKCLKIGYFPDSFGNAGQMPQLMKQAGMKAIVFGRGVKPTGADNAVFEGYSSTFSELVWKSPDGSGLPAVLFANWYNNGSEIPEDGNKEYWDGRLQKVEKYASTTELLMMNGCDHQPLQRNISAAIKATQENYPEYNFIHSSFDKYVDDLIKVLPKDVSSITGELIGQDTDGWHTLVNTCSSHVDLKIMNRKCELLLESVAEPLCVISASLGKKPQRELCKYAWKTLIKNHPHDSICGCSCDEVNDEMRIRFVKSEQAAKEVVKDELKYISKHIDKKGFEDCSAVFAVINTSGKTKTGLVNMDVDTDRNYRQMYAKIAMMSENIYDGEYELVDQNGNVIPCTFGKERMTFGYVLPEDSFRAGYLAHTVSVSFEAKDVPAMGYSVYGIRKTDKAAQQTQSLVNGENTMENQYISVKINKNGTVDVTDKVTGKTFSNMLMLEDTADVGNEYTYIPVKDDVPVYSGQRDAKIELVENSEFSAQYKISYDFTVPACQKYNAYDGKEFSKYFVGRRKERSEELVDIPVEFYVTLSKNAKRVDVKCNIDNKAKDHRLRVLFPTDLECTTHRVESVFEAATRNNVHKPTWTYPSGCEHQQGFVMLKDEKAGVAVANIGLYEYEVMKDNSIALTLVRSTAELGDWGYFPTQLSQQQKKLSFDFSVIPFDKEDKVYSEASFFQIPFTPVQLLEDYDDTVTCDKYGIEWQGEDIRLTCFKLAEGKDDVVMRFVNYSGQDRELKIQKNSIFDKLCLSNVIEEKKEKVEERLGSWTINVKPYEILTLIGEK